MRESSRRRGGVRYALLLVAALVATALAGCTPFWAQQPTTHIATPTVPQAAAACPAWTAPPAPATLAPPASADPQTLAAYNAERVLRTPRPIRNLYDITRRLTKHLDQAIPCRTRSTPRDERIGAVTAFYVVNASQVSYHQIQAKLVAVTAHVYMYLQQGAQADLNALRNSAQTFEQRTYATDRGAFGSEWSPGPDDDQHITVLNALNLGPIGGYFSSEDEYPRAVSPYSNERQMIYVNLNGGMVPGTPDYSATLAHEFQHMIHWYWHPADDSWTNEGMSVLAQHLNGYSSGGVDYVFLRHPDTMLGGWTDDQNADVAHYGAGYLFMDYFAEHYGGPGVLRELLTDPEQAPLNFDHVLAAHGFADPFNDVFAKFVVANLLDDPGVQGGIYAYPSIPGEQAQPQHRVAQYPYADGSAAQPASMPQYATQYYDFTPTTGAGARTLALDFQGTPYTRIVANTPANDATAEWWSNSANDMDSTLTRAFDLSGLAGKQVALTFQAWYDLEPGFDYGYVEASTDGGQQWTPLTATTSTSDDPNGANVGHGITGTSGGAAVAQWVPETVDLSAYAGKRILLRFETITDDAVHYPGLTIDDIHLAALGFSDDVATDGGWQAAGWIRSNNVLPQRFVVQAVIYRTGQRTPEVRQVPVDAASGAAHLSLPQFGGSVSLVTVAVAALAPATIVPATYRLDASLQ